MSPRSLRHPMPCTRTSWSTKYSHCIPYLDTLTQHDPWSRGSTFRAPWVQSSTHSCPQGGVAAHMYVGVCLPKICGPLTK
jgi:hypothetical protein